MMMQDAVKEAVDMYGMLLSGMCIGASGAITVALAAYAMQRQRLLETEAESRRLRQAIKAAHIVLWSRRGGWLDSLKKEEAGRAATRPTVARKIG